MLLKNLQIAATPFFENLGEQKNVETNKINFNYKYALLIWDKFSVCNHGQNIWGKL